MDLDPSGWFCPTHLHLHLKSTLYTDILHTQTRAYPTGPVWHPPYSQVPVFFHEMGQWAYIHSKCLSLFKLSTTSLNYFAIGWFHFHVRDTFDVDAYECCVGIHAVTSVHAREWLLCLSADALVQFTSFVRNCYACTLRLSKNTLNLAVLYNSLTQ